MSHSHIDFERFALRAAMLPSTQERAHLDMCASCRQQLQLLSQAERVLAGSPELPSSAQADTVLQTVLSRVNQPAAPAHWLQRFWLPSLATVGVLGLLVALRMLLWAPADAEFQIRGNMPLAEIGVRAFCVNQGGVEPLSPGGNCPTRAKVSVSVFLKPQQPRRALLYMLDSQHTLLKASSESGASAGQGLPVGIPGADPVIDAYIDLQQAALGPGHIVVALCSECIAAEIEELLLRGTDGNHISQSQQLWIERLPINVVGVKP